MKYLAILLVLALAGCSSSRRPSRCSPCAPVFYAEYVPAPCEAPAFTPVSALFPIVPCDECVGGCCVVPR